MHVGGLRLREKISAVVELATRHMKVIETHGFRFCMLDVARKRRWPVPCHLFAALFIAHHFLLACGEEPLL